MAGEIIRNCLNCEYLVNCSELTGTCVYESNNVKIRYLSEDCWHKLPVKVSTETPRTHEDSGKSIDYIFALAIASQRHLVHSPSGSRGPNFDGDGYG